MSATLPRHPVLALAEPLPPPPVPEGWQIGPPDFVGLGAMRAGTTWWWAMLKRHPGICSHDGVSGAGPGVGDYLRSEQARAYLNKEFHFFDHLAGVADLDPAEYSRYFPRPPGQLAGEWTPRYLYDFWTAAMLARLAPRVKLLVLLRDPVDRFVSGLSRFADMGFPVDSALANEQFQRGLYWQQLANLTQHFPRDQVLVLQYEQCAADVDGQMARTLGFLGLDPGEWQRPADPAVRFGILASGSAAVSAQTLAAVRLGYRADTERLFADYPELVPELWPSVAG
jgi:hypothetical protein